MLFAIASAVRIRESQTVTQKAAYWLLPPSIDKVGYHRIQDIDFTSARTKKKQLDHAISILPATPEVRSRRKLPTVDEPTEDEMMALYQTLDKSDSMPVLLSLKPGFSKKYVPKVLSKKYPEVLSELQDENYVTALPETILKHCTTLFSEISVSEEEAKNVESAIRLQSRCKAWFSFRTGRITASRMKSVCRTSVDKPAKSLIRDICYPSTTVFKSKYTEWGCDHEREATEQYQAKMCDIHENFTLLDSGLVLHPNYPFFRATPGGIAKCDCCGTVIVEIKCPYCKRNSKVDETVDCLEVRDGELRLSRKHGYYYQVQCQLLVTQQEYCDFIVWTQADYFQERIQIDMAFCNTLVDKSKDFFIKAVLPELVGKMCSRPMPVPTSRQHGHRCQHEP
ncbi:PREDICTED: uncharacterized protein LOC106810469 [Priapulus caudatus]|uniref:Uncharacterized protein LOC106810469 n=1 Tax=Priapulus caudatus TaxID=37621 RepID=A0ABM1EAW1_PRICU|nr:PREDICTED: uncharacterized protein LOC106810469 [Priapulus caudatus]